LRAIPYTEIEDLVRYLRGHSPFETKHGVKGEEFDSVLGVFGRGWNDYDFNRLLEMIPGQSLQERDLKFYSRNRNLFYVVCSRPKTNLALLFTQRLSSEALETAKWLFGAESLHDLGTSLN
jgi:DNA helicase-2/ATP-dependent DNA helicase PcrA